MAGVLGFEPRLTVLETVVLPLTLHSYGPLGQNRTAANRITICRPTTRLLRVYYVQLFIAFLHIRRKRISEKYRGRYVSRIEREGPFSQRGHCANDI